MTFKKANLHSGGRPRRTDLDPILIGALRRRRLSWRAIAKAMEAGVGTVRRIYAAWLVKLARMKQDQHTIAPKPPDRAKTPKKPIQ